MATKKEKKNKIRTAILDAAEIYSAELAGKTFLYDTIMQRKNSISLKNYLC